MEPNAGARLAPHVRRTRLSVELLAPANQQARGRDRLGVVVDELRPRNATAHRPLTIECGNR